MLLSFQKLLHPPLCQKLSIFTDAAGHGIAAYYTKDCHKVENTFLPLLKGQSFMLLSWS
jgi:hypothetical protein